MFIPGLSDFRDFAESRDFEFRIFFKSALFSPFGGKFRDPYYKVLRALWFILFILHLPRFHGFVVKHIYEEDMDFPTAVTPNNNSDQQRKTNHLVSRPRGGAPTGLEI